MNQFRQMNPVPQETRDQVKAIFEQWQRNQVNREVYIEAKLENYEEDEDEYEEDNEDNEEAYCPACGFPNCSGYCL